MRLVIPSLWISVVPFSYPAPAVERVPARVMVADTRNRCIGRHAQHNPIIHLRLRCYCTGAKRSVRAGIKHEKSQISSTRDAI